MKYISPLVVSGTLLLDSHERYFGRFKFESFDFSNEKSNSLLQDIVSLFFPSTLHTSPCIHAKL
jgi:hypothetical protein